MKIFGVVLAAVLLSSTFAFASDVNGDWHMDSVTCSGGTKLDLAGANVTMSVSDTHMTVNMEIADLPGCVLRQVSQYKAEAGKILMTPIANSATEQCGDDFSIDMTPVTYGYVLTLPTLTLTSPSVGNGGCPEGETETTVLTQAPAQP